MSNLEVQLLDLSTRKARAEEKIENCKAMIERAEKGIDNADTEILVATQTLKSLGFKTWSEAMNRLRDLQTGEGDA